MDYIKNKLKETRDAIDKKDYKTALENCTEIVQYDDKNFMIHLFLGVSNFNLNNLAAAEKSYIQSVKLLPTSPIPLRGLLELYNKTNEIEKISNTLKQLIPLTTDAVKKKELVLKLIECSIGLKDYKTTIELIEPILKEEESIKGNIGDRLKLLDRFEEASFQYYQIKLKNSIDDKLREKNIPIVDYSKSYVIGSIQHTPEQKLERDKIEFEINKSLVNEFNYDIYKELLQGTTEGILNNEIMIRIYTHYIQLLILCRRYGNEVEQIEKRIEIKEQCNKMNEMLSTPVYSMEILINLMEEEIGGNGDQDQLYELINSISKQLTSKYPNRGLGWIGCGFYQIYKMKDYTESSKQLIEKGFSNTGSTDSLLGYLSLSKWYLEAQTNHERVKDIITKSSIVFEQKQRFVGQFFNDIYIELQNILVESYCFNCNFEFAQSLLQSLINKFPNHTSKLIFSLAKLLFNFQHDYIGSKSNFEKLLQDSGSDGTSYKVQATTYLPWIDVKLKLDKEELVGKSLQMIKSSIEMNCNYLNLYVQGLIYIELGEIENAIQSLLKSAKLNSNYSDTFSKLGTLYKSSDKERSKKCYQKSLSLDILNGDSGYQLGEYYAMAGQTSLVMSLYKEITDYCLSQVKRFPINVVKCSWAFYRLSIYQMDNKDIHSSVVSLLNAIKGEPNNECYWRTLAEAYKRQFKYVASLKSLKKAEEILDNEHRIATDINFQIATLSKTLGLYQDAILEFDRVLVELKNNVPSLKGKAECLLQLARDQFKFRNFRQSLIHCQDAENSIKTALDLEPSFHSLWRLYADISGFFLNLPSGSTDSERIDHIEKSKQSSDAYFNCVKIHSNAHSLQDLSIGYFNQYIIFKNYLKNGSPETTKTTITMEDTENLLKSSIKCIVEALNLSPNDSMLWNLMGVLLMDKFPEQSQHALIRSIQLDSSKSEPYNNLSLLYFEHGFLQQSDQSLMIAKNNNVDSIISWSLQGLINEVKSSSLISKDSKDLKDLNTGREDYNYIDNALESSPIGQGLLGYGITSLLEGYTETGYSVLYKYVELNPNSIEANNSLGLVYSHQNDFNNSEKYFKSALNLLKQQKVDESNDGSGNIKFTNESTNCSIGSILFNCKPITVDESDVVIFSNDEKIKYVCINLSRTQYYQSKFEDALETIKPYLTTGSTTDSSSSSSISNSILWELASLIYCKLNKLDQSIDSIKKSISQITVKSKSNDERKQNLLLTMAKIQYSSGKKTITTTIDSKLLDTIVKILETSISIDNKFYKAWYYLSAVYIDCGKNELAKKLLLKLQSTVECLEVTSYLLLSKIEILNGNIDGARKQLQKAVHLFPLEPITWTSLAELELQYYSDKDPSTLPLSLLGHSLNNKSTQQKEYSGMGQLSIGPDHKVLVGPSVKDLQILAKANLSDQQSPWTKCLDGAIVIIKRIIHSNPLDRSIENWIHLQNLLYWRSLYTNDTDDWEATKSTWSIISNKLSKNQHDNQIDQPSFKFQQTLIQLEYKLALETNSTDEIVSFKKLLADERNQKDIKDSNEKQSILLSLESKLLLKQGNGSGDSKTNALSIYKQALKLDPTSISIYHNMSDIYESNDQFEISLLCLNRALSINNSSTSNSSGTSNNGLYLTTLSKIIRIYCLQKKFKDALKLLDESINSNPLISDNSTIKLLKGILIVGSSKLTNSNLKQFTNDMKTALSLLEDSISENSKLSLSNFYSAVVQFNLKNFTNSESLLQKELSITPSLSPQINSLQEKIKQFTK